MIDLSFFYSAKMAVVFFILMLSSATLEAQRNENDKFFNLMTAIGEDFGGEFNDVEKALELDLNGANSFLEELQIFATREIVRKNKNGEFECKEPKKPDFQMAITTILKPNKKVEDLIKELSEKFSGEKLFNLLFSFAARLEAFVHGKKSNEMLKEKKENSKDKIQSFLAVPKCFILPESKLSIFDYWIEIIKMKTKNSRKTIYGVAIYKEKYDDYKSEDSKEEAFALSRENYKILKQLNEQKFSIYESLNLLRAAFNLAYAPCNQGDEENNRRYAAQIGKQKHILRCRKISQIFVNLRQIHPVFHLNWTTNKYSDKNKKCVYAMFFQNISENLMKMMSDKGIDPKLHLDSEDKEIREKVQKDVEENCKKFANEEAKLIFLNNVHYELAINFEYNQQKDVYDRVDDLLHDWIGDYFTMGRLKLMQLSEESYLKENAFRMLYKIENFISNTNRETISIIEALIGKEFNLVSLFDQMKWLVKVAIPKEEAKLRKAQKERDTKQLEKDIKFLKNNPKSIAEEKYQKAATIICTIKQHDKTVKMLKSKITSSKIQEQLKKLSSNVQQYRKDLGPELWKQTEEFCNQLKHKQLKIKKEKIVSDEELLEDLQFEFDQIWKSIEGIWGGIEEYYLEIPRMQLIEEVRTLAKTFGKMLQNVKELYAQKMDASNVGGDMIMSE